MFDRFPANVLSGISTAAKVLRYEEEIKGAAVLVCTFALCLFTFVPVLTYHSEGSSFSSDVELTYG